MIIYPNKLSAVYDSVELAEIFNLTLCLCKIDAKGKRRSKTACRYWERVVQLWKNNVDTIGYNVIYAALYSIYWGIYPLDMPKGADLLRLIELVKLEILKVNEDTRMLKERQFFGSTLTAVMKSGSPHAKSGKGWKAKSYRKFLNDHIKYRLYGGEYVIEHLNLLSTPHSEFEELKRNAHTRKRYEDIKGNIIRVLPEAKAWSDEMFLNEAYLLDRLKAAHGIDYSRKWYDFDCLIEAIEYVDRRAFGQYMILNMEKVPMDLARIIWPNETEACIERLFNDVFTSQIDCMYMLGADRPYGRGYEDNVTLLKQSWLYCQIEQWRENKTYAISDETRRLLFNFALGI